MRSRPATRPTPRTSTSRGDTVRRLTAEQLADAVDFATGTREKYQGLPLGTRAIQLPDSEVQSYLMDTFGRPARQVLCECERTATPNIAQAMHLLNGATLNRKIGEKTGRVEKLIADKVPLPKAVEELYLATWSRLPVRGRAEEGGGVGEVGTDHNARACRTCSGC